ncbi:MAG: hypothetical protein KY454_13260 [Actinobacteria bacterium]|nr:hypothetical protein [Actinomycetota bacterium]
MPTFVWLARFGEDFKSLTPAQQAAFLVAVEQFVEDLSKGGQFRKGLRVKGVRGAPGIFEMTWAVDGRATFQYGAFVTPGEPHVIWRRIGTHQIFKQP